MQKLEPRKGLLISGPIWLFQLWLTTTFESKLHLFVRKDYAKGVSRQRVEGTRLALFTPREIRCFTKNLLAEYFNIFLHCDTFIPSVAPVVS